MKNRLLEYWGGGGGAELSEKDALYKAASIAFVRIAEKVQK